MDRGGRGCKKRRKWWQQEAARRTSTRASNGGERGHEEQESGRRRRRRRRGSGRTHGNRTGASGEEVHKDWNIRVAESLDWNIRGRSGPGLESGQQKEEEATVAQNGEENMNDESWELRGEDMKNRIRRRPRSTEATQDRNNGVVRTGVPREETALEWSVRERRRVRKRWRRRGTAKIT